MADAKPIERKRIGLLPIIGIFALIALVGIAGLALWSRAQLSAVRKEFEANEFPTSLAELNSRYASAPDNDNAALGFLAAAKAGREFANDERLPGLCSGTSCKRLDMADGDTLTRSAALIQATAEALRLAHAAAQLRQSRYPVDLRRPPIELNHYNSVTWVARLLMLEGAVAARNNDAEGATVAFVSTFVCARSLAREPILMSLMTVQLILPRLCEEIASALGAVQFSESQLARLAAAAEELRESISLDRTLAGESVFGLFSEDPSNGFARPLGNYDRAEYARFIRHLLEVTHKPPNIALPALESMTGTKSGMLMRYLRPMTDLIEPTFVRASTSITAGMVWLDLCQLSIATERYRLRHGALPQRFFEFAPDFMRIVPLDPYSGRLYLCAPSEKGFTVYSVGPDRTDDHGAPMDDRRHGDIVLRVAR